MSLTAVQDGTARRLHKDCVDISLADVKRDAAVRHLATVGGGVEP
jgi:hypothetical protein